MKMSYAVKENLKICFNILLIIIAVIIMFFGLVKSGFRNVDEVRLNALPVIEKNGFQIAGYQGYWWDPCYGGTVTYTLTKGNITYQTKVIKWFDEYHLYKLKAIDAIKP